jgi:Late embryogenesis abundant protein
MKSNTILILVLVAVVGYWAYTKYGAVSNLLFVPRGINASGGGFQVTLGIQNTSNTSLQYNSFAGSLIVNGSNIGNVTDFTQQTIIANGETDLVINVTANLLGLASQILQQVNSGNVGIQSAVLTGNANIGGTQYPVNVTLV